MSNNREFSQLASFIKVLEGSDYIGIATDGTQVVGIGTTLIKLDGTTGEITANNFVGPSGSSLIDKIYLQEENSPVGSGFTTIRFIGDHITVTDAQSGIASVTVDISDYVGSISGTTNQIEIDSGTGSGSTPTISLSDNVSISTSLTVGTASTGVVARSDGSLYVTGIATFTDNVIFDSINAVQIPAGTTEERGFRLLETKTGTVSGVGTNRITGINTVGIETGQYILGPSGVLRSNTQVTSVGIGSIGIGLTALHSSSGSFKFGTISVVAGQIRYNSELSSFEGYGPGNAWGSLGGIKDVDADTYITAESSAGADEDTLTFYTAGTSRVVIDSNGNVGIGTDDPLAKLEVKDGSVYVPGGTFDASSLGSGNDSKTDAALVIDRSSAIYVQHDGYLRNLIEPAGTVINIGQHATSHISEINLKPGNADTNGVKLHHGGTTDNVKLQTLNYGVEVLGGLTVTDTNAIELPAGTTEERGFRTLETKTGNISGVGTNTITGINTSGIEVNQYVLGPSGVLRENTQVTSVDIGSIGIGLTALAASPGGTFRFGPIDFVAGQIRYNSDSSSFEGYGPNNSWGPLSLAFSDGGGGTTNQSSGTLTIEGTGNEVEVDLTDSTYTVSLPDDVTIGQDLTVLRNLQVDGNITVGGTSGTLFTETLQVADADLILGIRTDANGNDISTDNTASHGGVALASTEGTPLVTLVNPGAGETLPATYKKIMWFKKDSFTGLGTDAWLINYGVGIGSTQVPDGVRLAAGGVHISETNVKAKTFESTIATGTAPLTVASTTLVTNLNADKLDGQDGSYYLDTSSTGQTKLGDLTLSKDGSPTFVVETSKNSNADALIKIRGARTASSTSDIAMLQFDNATGSAYTMAQISAMDPAGAHADGKGKLVFRTATGGTLSDQVTIMDDGDVGIGTTNPVEKLEVDGGYVKATGFKASGTTGFLKSDGSIDNTAYGVGNLDAVLIKQNGSNVGDGQYTTLDFYGGAVAITTTATVGVASVRIEESDTLDSVTARGNSTTNNLSVGVLTSTELKETYNSQDWNVVTQADIGYGASQVPLNQYLGQLAFLDDYHPNGLRRDGGGFDDVFVNSSGNVGVNTTLPTETLDVVGNVKAVDFNATSDENLKTNIRTIEDPLAKVVQIRGVNFDWKETQRPSLGVIAQEIEKVLPELVTDNGTKTVNYNGLIGLLIEAVKAQQEEIDILKSKIK